MRREKRRATLIYTRALRNLIREGLIGIPKRVTARGGFSTAATRTALFRSPPVDRFAVRYCLKAAVAK